MNRTQPITGELLRLKEQIEAHAKEYGLSFFDVRFEVCDYDTVNILAAQGGFPTRYPHWRFGMEYDQLSKGYAYGVQKIYEMVINTDPCYAYLLKANHLVDQKTVMSHVYGHADFFKNNAWFSTTNRRMMDVMANHGAKIRRYTSLYGIPKVESFIDKVLSLENLIDIQDLFETSEVTRHRREVNHLADEENLKDHDDGRSDALKSFMRSSKRMKKKKGEKADKDRGDFSQPDSLQSEEKKDEEGRNNKDQMNLVQVKSKLDIMKFLAENAPITEWQSDIIGILREEAYYFLPQRLTKIMNEGWASYWHSTMMTQKVLESCEIVDFADHHSGVMQMSRKQLNPYKLGIELFRDIEYRWNTGRFGKEYNECRDMREKEHWDTKLGGGRDKIFDVRKTHNDITFIDEFLTPDFCERQQIFTYKYNTRTGRFEIDTRDFEAIRAKLLTSLTNFGSPVIEIEDANFANRGEILLKHRFYGVELDMAYAHDTMKNIYAIWHRPINLQTKYDNKEIVFVYDGKDFKPLS